MKRKTDEDSDDGALRVDAGVDTTVVVNPILPGDRANDQAAMDLVANLFSYFCSCLVGAGGRGEEDNQQGVGYGPDPYNDREVDGVFVVGDCKKTQ